MLGRLLAELSFVFRGDDFHALSVVCCVWLLISTTYNRQPTTNKSVHFRFDVADAKAVVVEADVGVIGEQGHRAGGVGDLLGDHQGGEALAEGVVVHAGVPDGDGFGFPGFDGPDGGGLGGDHGDIAAAGGAGVLDDG